MRHSGDRILTTHVGSLPRSRVLSDLLIRQERGETIDRAALDRECHAAVRHVVGQQVASGVDVINDGEQPRVGFRTGQKKAESCKTFSEPRCIWKRR